MPPSLIKILVRSVGSIFALLGLLILGTGLFIFLPGCFKSGEIPFIFGCVFCIVLGAGLLQIGWLVWFRFSRNAVRQTLGSLAFIAFGASANLGTHSGYLGSPTDLVFFFLLPGIAVYAIYRSTLSYFNRRLFPTPDGGALPAATSPRP